MAAKRKARASNHKDGTDKKGYGSPPKERQYKPGQSGNPTGKRKGTKNRTTILREILNRKIWIVEDGKRRKISYHEGLLRAIADSALNHRNFKYVYLLLKLSDAVEADDRRYAGGYGYAIIDETMTPKEAADAYAATLAAIPGMMEPDFDIDDL